ncbi:hypothetical protein BC834DRAFT_831678 [Gloeopeniophorella convolvens]|nr:hypothetical protein BC834DRAFT_831678 [Gloeopeniophorella convolvens]
MSIHSSETTDTLPVVNRERSASRGRPVFPSGRGGVGNIRRSLSREPHSPVRGGPDDFSDTRGRELVSSRDPNKVISTGIGGAGNIRSPSQSRGREPPVPESPPRFTSGSVRTVGVLSAPFAYAGHAQASTGRGGAGNIVQRSPSSNSSPSASRSRSRGPAMRSTGRGGAGNIVATEPGAALMTVDEAAHRPSPPPAYSTGRGGAANIARGPAPPVEQPATSEPTASSGRGGTGNIRRDASRGPGIAGLLQRVARSASRPRAAPHVVLEGRA